jgi:hypothetical protein
MQMVAAICASIETVLGLFFSHFGIEFSSRPENEIVGPRGWGAEILFDFFCFS